MQQPKVCAVCVTANRQEFTRQAIGDFRAQSYPNKCLVVWDTSDTREPHAAFIADMRDKEYYIHDSERLVIGQLRNRANSYACSGEGFGVPDILMHLDSDDRSHPNRIAEQVALLQSSGADVVGYSELLFWREPWLNMVQMPEGYSKPVSGNLKGEAWLYRDLTGKHPPGSSLAFWRRTWEHKPFQATSHGEDRSFVAGLKVASISSVDHTGPEMRNAPRMVCRIHPGNTSSSYANIEQEARKKNPAWQRVPQWDSYCAEIFSR